MSVKKQYNKNLSIDIGKMPPQNIEYEEAVLGILMTRPEAVNVAINYLIPESFYKDAHQKIYTAILSLNEQRINIDQLTVTTELKKQQCIEEVGGIYYVIKLTDYPIVLQASFEQYCKEIKESYNKRELIRLYSEGVAMAYDENYDSETISSHIGAETLKCFENNKQTVVKIGEIIGEVVTEIEKLSTQKIQLTGVPTTLTKIDSLTCGWQKTDLIIIAARPSIGKSAFSLKCAEGAAIFKKPVLFFSLEMSNTQLVKRLLSGKTGYTNMELNQGRVNDWNKIERGVSALCNLPIYLDETPALNIDKLYSRAVLYKQKFGIELIIIDYLQLITANVKGNREGEVSLISRKLKQLAKELSVPVIALSQLNRAVENRTGSKKPQLSDLRESGAIEQDADIVMFINRPEKYGVLEYEDGTSTKNVVECIFAKHRNGATGERIIYSNDSLTDFYDERFEAEFKPINNINQTIEANREFDENPF